jgi:hypothetical protein
MMYVLSDTRVINSRRMRGVGHVAHKGKKFVQDFGGASGRKVTIWRT